METPNLAPTAPPGFYDDGHGVRRWWTGNSWTEHTQQPAAPSPRPKGSAWKVWVVVLFIVALLVFVVVAAATSKHGATSAGVDRQVERSTAQELCEGIVKKGLKSPATAQFTRESATGYDPITVKGSVDSQNSFGALVRSTFTCVGTVDSGETVHASLTAFNDGGN